ncbi:hypothetical protein TRSC58_03002 [Trypanosoma rangeli SC58]|uniref:Uncharacterized protein n=1 Tax=Trypanosoma rangeli SC58 TaxID=429131 RepID=A0A061J573_TRYRA|nr:hypothetical protein TRSC58_03002 [Trypanosoma rangeli SC58]
MIDTEDLEEDATLTGAELLHYLARRNEQQREENTRKLQDYTKLQEVLENLTDRCRVPVLAPVAGGMAYFEATMDYTNNILVLLGDNWFAERSARQAREIAGRRIEFLRREEHALVEEASALQQRQSLFLSEIPNAERATLEVEALKEDALHGRRGDDSRTTLPATAVTAASQRAGGGAGEANEAPVQLALRDEDLAVIDELDQLTEEELLEIERELGDRVEDDELVERVMTERIIAKKERRVCAELQKGRVREPPQRGEDQELLHSQHAVAAAAPAFSTPGDIGRAAAVVVSEITTGDKPRTTDPAVSLQRHVKFKDVVDVISPEGATTTMSLAHEGGTVERPFTCCHVVGDVVEHDVAVVPSPAPPATAPKRKSLFRSELEQGGR